VAAGTNDTNRAGNDQEKEVMSTGECHSGGRHQHRADNQHAAAAEAIRVRREEERNQDISSQRESEQQAGL
jgi:hypothetical protein